MLRNMLRNNGLSILTYDFFIMIHDSELSFKVLGRFGNMLRTCCATCAQCCATLRNIAQWSVHPYDVIMIQRESS
jgi:hypothetical protein